MGAACLIDGWNVGAKKNAMFASRSVCSTICGGAATFTPSCFEQIRAPTPARHRSIAVLRHLHAARSDDNRCRRRDIERPRTISASAARIEHVARRRRQRHRVLAHRPRETDDLLRTLTFHHQRRKKTGQRAGRGTPLHDLAHGLGGLVGREVLVANELLDELREHHRSRKFRRIFRPSPVSTDSGWNCTPWTGYTRCRTAMIVPSSCVRAATSRSPGTLSGPMTSE